MARKKKEDAEDPAAPQGDEVRGAQTNTAEQANAPQDSTAQQAAQQAIAEGSATVNVGAAPSDPASGTTTPTSTQQVAAGAAPDANPPAAGTAAVQAQAKPVEAQAPVASTQAEGGAKAADGAAPPQPAAPAGPDAPKGERDKTPIEKQDAKTVAENIEAQKAAGVEMIAVTVDGVEVEVPKGTLAIEACFQAGADVPYFCYHPRLTSVGACRMCLVSIELEMFGQRRAALNTCCTVPVAPGMVIQTQLPEVKKAQNGILEFLLANHPLDCPICDRGGECPLQNMTIAYGPPTSRFIEEKRHWPKAMPISDYVVLDRERCIQCMRCTRFTEEIAGDGQLSLHNRGAQTEIGTFYGHDFSSNFSGNTIEICPVGALTSRTYRFAGRPWEIKSTDSVCSKCGNGCNVAVQTRLGDLVRVNGRTNEEVNYEWTCDRGKFGQYYVNDENRLKSPLVRAKDGSLVEATWEQALSLVAGRIRQTKAQYGADALAFLGSTRCTLEENYLLGKLARGLVGTNNIDHQMSVYPFEPMQSSIASIEDAKVIVSVGMQLDLEQPIVYLRVYRAVSKKGAKWVKADAITNEAVDALIAAGDGGVLLLPHTLAPGEVARARAICARTGAKLNILLPDCNSWGAPRAGASPGYLPGMTPLADARTYVERAWGVPLPAGEGRTTDQIFAGMAAGDVKLLYVMGSDPAVRYHDPAAARRALEGAEFVVVQELFLTETARYADVVLPAASFAEKDGTFVNIEGREQKIKQALAPRGNSRPDWRILADLMGYLGTPVPYFSARDIYREYSRAIPKPATAAV